MCIKENQDSVKTLGLKNFHFFVRPASYAVEEVYIYFQRNEV